MSAPQKTSSPWLVYTFRCIWIVVAFLTIGMTLLHISKIYTPSSLICTPSEDCLLNQKFTASEIASLPDQGKSLFNFLLAIELFTWIVWIGTGLLVFWWKSDESVGWLGSLFLITFLSSILTGYIEASAGELRFSIISFIIAVGQLSFVFFLYIFPDGKFFPRWSRWPAMLIPILAIWIILATHLLPSPNDAFGPGFGSLYFGLFGLGVILQIFRYFRVSTPIQRLQTKWIVLAIAMLPLSDLVLRSLIFPKIFPAMMIPGMAHIVWNAVTIPLFRTVPFVMIPVSFGFSILRYRLWAIDILIRRTLQYSLLTGLLALVYFAGVTVLQSIFTAVTGQQSAASLVLSTLAIAALFNPLRSRIQDFIDRRFYRQKYDAEQALAEFAAAARSETDLAQLSERLTGTVQETLQPSMLSLWLRPAKLSELWTQKEKP